LSNTQPDRKFITIARPQGQAFAFGDPVPDHVRLTRNEAIKFATRVRLQDRQAIVQIIDVETGKVLNVEQFEDDPRVVLITHDVSNGCGT
jgi:hypothetical protein